MKIDLYDFISVARTPVTLVMGGSNDRDINTNEYVWIITW